MRTRKTKKKTLWERTLPLLWSSLSSQSEARAILSIFPEAKSTMTSTLLSSSTRCLSLPSKNSQEKLLVLLNNKVRANSPLTFFTDAIDPSIRERFNPCIYLAEFLMRNNPNHAGKLEYEALFLEQARIEKIKRFFTTKR